MQNRNAGGRGGGGGGRFVRESRPHDYIYDPNYTICSQKDFYKDAAYGARSGAQIKLRPIFPSMFSELITDRRLEACLVTPKPNILENFMPQPNVSGIPVRPMDKDCVQYREVEPTGADRARFIMNYTPASYEMARPQIVYNLEDEKKKNQIKLRRGFYVHRAVQTDFRESETQTDPYSPPFTLPYSTAYPKVLALLKMTWGKGLPATLEDIVVIERALTRRLLEIGVHDIDDETDFERRVKLMEELEAQQWADREKELNALMLQKMDLVSKALDDLKTKIANTHTMKMERLYETKKRETSLKLAQIRHHYLRSVRRIEDKCSGKKNRVFKRDKVQDYLQFDSPVYTPLLRNGPNIESMYKPPKYEFRDHFDVDDFDTLTNQPHFVKNEIQFDRVKFAKRLKRTQLSRTEKRLDMNLMSIYDAFREETLKKVKQDDSAFMKQVITSTIHRMSTPTVEGHDLAQEHQELCVLNLQKVIRGRVVQILMRDEIKENMASILQLKALHKADPFGLNTTYGEAMRQISLQDDRELQQETQNEVTEIMDQLEGESLARMFDFLDKEMIRLLDERKIHALMILAERERRIKEATEAGRRQQEEDDRRINDEIFRQIVGVHQATVDMYLEDMYLETINRTADSNAREYVLGLARTLNEAAYITTQNDGEMEKEEMAAELVHCFMLPEMNRIYQRERLDTLASRYTLASHEVTDATFSAQGVINETLDSLGPTIQEHMERGAAAVEGAQFAVDNIIKGAVSSMMKQVYPKKHPTEVEQIEQEKFKYYQDLPGLKPPEPEETEIEGEQDDDFPEEEFEPVSPQHSIHSVQALTELAIVDPSSEIEILSDEERDEILAEVEATLEAIPPVIIPVIPEYSHELGEKSIQLTFGGEVESDVVKLYQEATVEVKDLFTETAKLFKPPEKEESSEEETDEELDIDDDDD